MGLSFGFLPFRRPNKLLSYTKQLFLCLFAADAILKGRTPCLHLHALCIAFVTRKCKHSSPGFFGSQFIIARMRSSFVFRDNVSSFSHWGGKTICLFPTNLASPGNIRRDNVSATMFLSLARPLNFNTASLNKFSSSFLSFGHPSLRRDLLFDSQM